MARGVIPERGTFLACFSAYFASTHAIAYPALSAAIDLTGRSFVSGSTVSIAITGAGGAGVMTAAQMLLDAAATAGLYGLMARSSGPQIRGGEVAAFLRLGARPVDCLDDRFDLMVALDWLNVERFAAEIVAGRGQPGAVRRTRRRAAGHGMVATSGRGLVALPLQETVKSLPGGRLNMLGLGLLDRHDRPDRRRSSARSSPRR